MRDVYIYEVNGSSISILTLDQSRSFELQSTRADIKQGVARWLESPGTTKSVLCSSRFTKSAFKSWHAFLFWIATQYISQSNPFSKILSIVQAATSYTQHGILPYRSGDASACTPEILTDTQCLECNCELSTSPTINHTQHEATVTITASQFRFDIGN